jgi:phosphoglycolate phosphatase-like HAD superfamily hydrolase
MPSSAGAPSVRTGAGEDGRLRPPVTRAIEALHARPAASALLGDSITDITAAHRAGIASIGFANKPGKHDALAHAGADVVIDDIHAILHAAALTSA